MKKLEIYQINNFKIRCYEAGFDLFGGFPFGLNNLRVKKVIVLDKKGWFTDKLVLNIKNSRYA